MSESHKAKSWSKHAVGMFLRDLISPFCRSHFVSRWTVFSVRRRLDLLFMDVTKFTFFARSSFSAASESPCAGAWLPNAPASMATTSRGSCINSSISPTISSSKSVFWLKSALLVDGLGLGGDGTSAAACILAVGVVSGLGITADSTGRCWLAAAIAWPWPGGGVSTSSVNKQNHMYAAVKLETCHGLVFCFGNQHYSNEMNIWNTVWLK